MSYRAGVRVLALLGCVLLLTGAVEAQRRSRQGGVLNTLWGDLKVEEPEGVKVPQTFILLLSNVSGREVGRDSVAPNGRYRFHDVENNTYVLTIQVENRVVYREQFVVYESQSTDIRKDIELVWKTSGLASESEGSSYDRSAAQVQLLDQAREATSKGDSRKSAELLEKLVKADGGDYEGWTELGTARFQLQKLDDAAKAYEKALELKPDYLPALVNLGKLRLAQKKYDQAIEPLTKAVEADPGRAESQYLLGEAYLGIRKGSIAVGYLNEAIRLDPEGMADVHLRLAQLYDRAGMKARAAAEYEQYLQKRPNAAQKKELEEYIAKNKGSGS